MKKIYFSMMAIAIAAFTFTACEDVPEPYNNPYDQLKNSDNGGNSSNENSTLESPFDVTTAIAKKSATGAYVKGYIVGAVSGKSISEGVSFSATTDVVANVIIAASADETDVTKCMPIQLPNGSDVRTKLNLKDNAGNYKKEVTLYGNITSYFGTIGLKEVTFAVLDGNEIGTNPNGGGDSGNSGDGNAIYSVNFKANGLSNWTIDNKTLPSGLTEIWKHDTKYGMVASAYISSTKTNYDSEAWLISPAIDLSAASSATLKIHQAINFFSSVDVAKTQAMVLASEDGTNWTELTLSGWPTALGWTFFDSTADFTAFAGKNNVKLALKYTSTAAKAGTWEVETITIE